MTDPERVTRRPALRVLHVIPTLRGGGAEKLMTVLLPCLNHAGQGVGLLVLASDGDLYGRELGAAGVPVEYATRRSIYSLRGAWKLLRLARNYDVVHAHLTPAQYLTAALSLLLGGKRFVTTEHSTANRRMNYRWLRPVDRWIYSRFSRIVCITDGVKEALCSWLGADPGKFTTIHNGVELGRFQNAVHLPRESLVPNRTNAVLVLMIARFFPPKDHITLVLAASKLPDVIVLLAGDGPLRADVRRLAIENCIADRVIFLGHRSDVPSLIKSVDITVLSTWSEGFGLAAVESMAVGVPVVASDVSGLREVLGDAGLLFKAGDPDDLAAKLGQLALDGELRLQLGRRGMDRAAKFGADDMAVKYANLYR